jgi:hypothetical protein
MTLAREATLQASWKQAGRVHCRRKQRDQSERNHTILPAIMTFFFFLADDRATGDRRMKASNHVVVPLVYRDEPHGMRQEAFSKPNSRKRQTQCSLLAFPLRGQS